MLKPSVTLGGLALLLCGACGSDERDLKISDFTFHECKHPGASGELETGRETSDYPGLECVAWRFSNGSGAIDLINRVEGCGFDGNDPSPDETLWTPKLVQTASNALTYSVSWEFEGASACGACLHDFSISAPALSLDDADVYLKLATRSCNASDCKWAETSLKIPQKELKEGIRCRYTDWNRVRGNDADKGTLGHPARDGACDDSLVAVELDGDDARCLKACADDDDCQTPLTKCKDGACQLADPW